MTSNHQPRRLRRQAGEENGSGGGAAADLSISERLRLAREARGVDLYRVERDTKIRLKYLAAMEAGLFSELPGDVYARGFLRNYASYLGIDPDDAESEWRRGNYVPAAKTPPAAAPETSLPAMRVPAASVPPTATASAGAPAFRVPGFRLPRLSWPPATTPPAASTPAKPAPAPKAPQTAPKAAPAAAKPEPAELSARQSPTWNRRALAADIVSFLRRRGKGNAAEMPIGGPKPMTVPGRAFLLQPAHIVLLLLVVVIVGVGLFFGMQAGRVLHDPTVTVTSPAQALTSVASGTTTFTLQGSSTGKAEISVSWDGRDPLHVLADKSGNWTCTVSLHNGNNQFDVWSTDLDTTHDSAKVTRVISVESPTASPVLEYLAVDSPLDGQTFRDGNFVLSGSTVSVASVTITATYLGPAPAALPSPKATKTVASAPTAVPTLAPMPTATPLTSASPPPLPTPKPNASGNPAPVSVVPTIDGKFSAQMHLWSGRWMLSVVGSNTAGVSSTPVELTVIVTAGSLVVDIAVHGGSPSIKIWKDGKVVAGYPHVVPNGSSVRIVADQSVWIFTGMPNYTYVTVNGVSFGRLGTSKSNKSASWRITTLGPPTPSNDR